MKAIDPPTAPAPLFARLYEMTSSDILAYEILRSGWAERVRWRWAQLLAAKYFAWRTQRMMHHILRQIRRERVLLQWHSQQAVRRATPVDVSMN